MWPLYRRPFFIYSKLLTLSIVQKLHSGMPILVYLQNTNIMVLISPFSFHSFMTSRISSKVIGLAAAIGILLQGGSVAFSQSVSSSSSSSSTSSSSSSSANMTISVTDGRDRVAPGGDLVYIITLRQNTVSQANTNVEFTLPSNVNTVSADNGGVVSGGTVNWTGVSVTQNQPTNLAVNVSILPSTPVNTVLTATARTPNTSGSDTTVVQTGTSANNSYELTFTDNRTTAQGGDVLPYVLTVKNTSGFTQTADVTVTASDQTAILTTNPTAEFSYPYITWRNQSFAAGETRRFTLDAQIDRRVSTYTAIRASAKVASVTATDTTTIGAGSRSSSSSHRSTSSSSRSTSTTRQSVLFRNSADASEVLPGGRVRYTLYVQNTGNGTIDDAEVNVRFSPGQLTFVNAVGGDQTSESNIRWDLPVLRAGQVWRATYILASNTGAQNGDTLGVSATISGSDISNASSNSVVTVAQVIGSEGLPATGAALDIVAIVAFAAFAAFGTFLQRVLR